MSEDITPEHLRVLRAYLKTRPAAKRQRRWEYVSYLLFLSFVGFGLLAIPLAPWTAGAPLWFAASPVIGLLVSHPVWHYLDRRGDAMFIAANAAELGHQEFWIDHDGFGNATPAGSTFHNWSSISAVEETEQLVFVAAGVHFYTLPRGGADAAATLAAFVAELRRRWGAGRGECRRTTG